MKKTNILEHLYVPIKDNKYILDGKGNVKIYKSLETLQKYMKQGSYDKYLVYSWVLTI